MVSKRNISISNCAYCGKLFVQPDRKRRKVTCSSTCTLGHKRNIVIIRNKSTEHRELVAAKAKGRSRPLGQKRTPEQCKRISAAIKQSWVGAVDRKRANIDRLKDIRYKSGKMQTRFGELYYRSGYEKRAIELLVDDKSVTSVVCEPMAIPYTYDGSTRHYFPDFIINGDFIIEVKPFKLLLSGKNMAKWYALRKYCDSNCLDYMIWDERVLYGKDMGIPDATDYGNLLAADNFYINK